MNKKYYCNKCDKGFKQEELNDSEFYKVFNNSNRSFVCSTCINKEMEDLKKIEKEGIKE